MTRHRPLSGIETHNTARSGNDKVPMLRRIGDFQVHSVLIDAILWLQSRKGTIVEFGCGESTGRFVHIDAEIAPDSIDCTICATVGTYL